jgi:hypothetical protein
MSKLHGTLVFCSARSIGYRLGFLDCFDLAPIVRGRIGAAAAAMGERQEEPVWLPVIGVPATTALHADKAKRFRFTDGRRNGVVVHPIRHEIMLGDRQVAVVVAAVVSVLDLDP